jgi:hypothetical protein
MLNPPAPGPRGCRTTLDGLPSCAALAPPPPFSDAAELGRLGTGGIELPLLLPNPLPVPNREPKCVEMRRVGVARVAKPSRMLPLDERELRRGAAECRVFMSGMDFFTRSEGGVCEIVGER